MPVSQSVTRDSRVIFSQGDRNFTVKDVIDWAVIRGDISLLWKDFLWTVEADRQANAEGCEVDDSALDAASVAFRYEHDLITAEETERWLEDRGLNLPEFSEHFGRRYWGRTHSSEMKPSESSYHTASPDEKDLFLIDLTLLGEIDRMADRLSWRIAAQAEEAVDDAEGVAEQCEHFLTRAKIDRDGLADWLAQLGRDGDWLNELLGWEVAYQRRAGSLVSEKDLQRELISMRLLLTQFEIEMIEVDSRDAAAEIMACVRNDGMEMAEVAEESRYPFHRSEILLEDLASEQQQQFLSVKAGALLEPIPREDSFQVCRVKSRIEPTLQDAAIRQRLEERIIERHFSELVSKHINWRILQQPIE
jgi:hypothetical protein